MASKPESWMPSSILGMRPEALVGGMVSGVAGTIIGHPLDLIKTRIQMGFSSTSTSTSTSASTATSRVVRPGIGSVALSTLRSEGISGLYRGLLPPMLSMVLVNAMSFGVFDASKRILSSFLQNHQPSSSSSCSSDDQDRHQSDGESHGRALFFAAGGMTALVLTPITTPAELVKVRAQLSGVGKKTRVSSLAVARNVISSHGLPALYTGYTVNGIREIVFVSLYFGWYESAKQIIHAHLGQDSKWARAAIPLAGGSAGALAWSLSFPLDVIKSDIQSQKSLSPRITYSAMWDLARSRFATSGLAGFYSGASASILRAFFVSGTRFSAYELAVSLYHRVFHHSTDDWEDQEDESHP